LFRGLEQLWVSSPVQAGKEAIWLIARAPAKIREGIADTDSRGFRRTILLLDQAICGPEELRIQIPHDRDFGIRRNVLLCNKAKVIFHIVGDEDLHGHVGAA
jgi:hypothetical protein